MVRVTCTRAECFATRGSAPIACPHQTVLCSDTPILGHRGNRSSSLSGTRTRAPIHQIMSAGMLAIAAGYATADAREVFRAAAGEIIVETIANGLGLASLPEVPGRNGYAKKVVLSGFSRTGVRRDQAITYTIRAAANPRPRSCSMRCVTEHECGCRKDRSWHSPSVGPLFAGQHRSERKRIRQGGKSPALDLLAVVRMLHDNCKVRAVCR